MSDRQTSIKFDLDRASIALSVVVIITSLLAACESSVTAKLESKKKPAAKLTLTADPDGGVYTSVQSVTLQASDAAAKIYYSLDGSTPSESSTLYEGPISISTSATLAAIAVNTVKTPSASQSPESTIKSEVLYAEYIIDGSSTESSDSAAPVATPTFSLASGLYTSSQSLSISTSTLGATIYYTTDGSTPSSSSTQYSGPISITSSQVIKAIASKSGRTNSSVATGTYMLATRLTYALSAGGTVTELPNGNIVISNSTVAYNGISNSGIVQLFNGSTGALISTLYGTTANDNVGATVTVLSNGNFVISSTNWDNGAVANVGAVTWCSATSGCNGPVSASNSLVGSTASDAVGSVTKLSNGNYVVSSTSWDNGAVTNVGAVTWCSGTTGCIGAVSSSNSLVGSTSGDAVGSVTALTNGNYVVSSTSWDNGAVTNVGAVTWCSGTTSCTGTVSTSNSLVGSTSGDTVGNVTALSNGNYVVSSGSWDNGAVTNVGAVTWCSGTTGCTGAISAANSLVGTTASDVVGTSITILSNGNYVVSSTSWDNGAATNAGAVTWCSGAAGCTGAVSTSNSLVGSTTSDGVGTVTALPNGNYVVSSTNWDNGAIANVGAVTWCSGITSCTGAISSSNSLIGSTASDGVGTITALSNGNYVVRSPNWDNGAVTNAGAVTWCSGTTGCTGAVSPSNSLVGSTSSDMVGSVTALSNGNYLVSSSFWDNGAITDAGAVTWCSGTTGCTGAVSSSNSLVGSTVFDSVGSLTALSNGNYVVSSFAWDNGAVADVGAVTWCSGTTGCTGAISTSNSLVGSTAGDYVGLVVTTLSNGNYVVSSTSWDNGAVTDVGAVTWCSGTTGCTGPVSASNRLIGSTASDSVGTVTVLTNGNYVVTSTSWDNGTIANAGAVSWCSGATGCTGAISGTNSMVGSLASDQIGSGGITTLTNGNFIVRSPAYGGADEPHILIVSGTGTTAGSI